MTKIIMIVLVLALIVLVHEWGHFIVARKMGVKVNEFAIGMGPKLWSTTKKDTMYSIRLLPFGGFCSMEGDLEGSNEEGSILLKTPWQKFLIYVAGAGMNFVLAIVFMFIVFTYVGTSTNIIEKVEEGMPAYGILQPNDKILSVEGVPIKNISDFNQVLTKDQSTYSFEVKTSGGQVTQKEMSLKWVEQENRARFGFQFKVQHFNVLASLKRSFIATGQFVEEVFKGVIQLFTGKVKADQLAGIVGISQISSDAWNTGMERSIWAAIINLINLGGFISANLCVMNLLPLPALDGGRILFALLEMLRGKPISPEKEGIVHFIGFVLLMGLTLFVLYNDVMRIIG